MRKLMFFAVGFAVACAVGVYLVSGNWLLLLAAFSLAGGVPLFFLKTKRGVAAAIGMMGCVFGFLWLWGYHQFYLNTVKSCDGETITATVEIADYSYETSYGYAADGKITLEDKTYNIRVYLANEGEVSPGDEISGKIRLRMTVEGSLQGATYHQGDGIFLLGYFDEAAVIQKAERIPVQYRPAQWRRAILKRIEELFPADTMGFAKALLLGDHYDLTYAQDTAFKLSGIRHVIAVSGLHVSILFSLVYVITGKQRYLAALLGIPVLILFAAAAGFTPSIVRACMMQGLMIVAVMLDKEYDPPTALAAAVLVMLVSNPITITSVSFQLSVGCMVGIFLFYRRIHDFLLHGKRKELAKGNSLRAKMVRWCVSSVSITLSAMITTTPLSAWYFGTVSLVGVVTNLLTLWLISFVFYGIMLSLGLGLVWMPVGRFLAQIVSWLMRYVMGVAGFLSKVPLAAVYTCSIYIVIWLLIAYVLFFQMLYSKKRKPLRTILTIVVCLAFCVSFAYLEPRMDDYRITVLDVGQGQCVVFQSGQETYVVDCGGDSDTRAADQAAQYLLSQGIHRLDGLFLTHYDMDHAGGVLPLLSRMEVETLYLPDLEDTGSVRQKLTEHCQDRITWVEEKTRLQSEGFTVTLLPAEGKEDKNENSMCLLFQRGNYDILITGDRTVSGEKELLRQTELPQLELLVLGHHGGATSTGLELLDATKPAMAAVSAGYGNFYNHPAPQVLTRLSLYGTAVYRTDLHGTIIFRG